MDNLTIGTLVNWRTFKTNQHELANALKISDGDAQQLLLTGLMEHRFKRYTKQQLDEGIAQHDTAIGWLITYQRKDLIRSHFEKLGKRAKAEYMSGSITRDVETGVIKLAVNDQPLSISEFKLQQVIAMFSTKQTRTFTEMLLRFGSEETMSVLSLSKKQFKRRLNYVIEYVTKHHERFELVTDLTRDRHLYRLNCITQLEEAINDSSDCDEIVQQWIDENRALANELIDAANVHFQGKVINDFHNASRADQYAFINRASQFQAEDQTWLQKSNEAIQKVAITEC